VPEKGFHFLVWGINLLGGPVGRLAGEVEGRILTIRADDVFKSTVHRAANRSGERRYSIPLFFGTDYDVLLEVGCLVLPPKSTGANESDSQSPVA
jgi:hypothetical protein